ncbi:hypothetical protein [Burkholderia pseudomallei]|uniref:hypothetical protein n=1 Tax=Burkholderia pseudomallei TaxID=28450 RepID=UPI000F088365|nr:hypothetical protein [Burkholderia pseudomallei]CAJ3073316.1 Uncharacterised protein [Burkholderia pseudomallei]VCK72789.1 Uncharacterised protein [Burkholderia pseudomallei]VCK79985.1 Uncharacterised protein [Burkholderia pseudomallei]VCK80028.1 Uncharacterised protein [Burkholderia pseudomallei]VCK80759.1 Uncharacterised protein [Burkholderia pseudomallei]
MSNALKTPIAPEAEAPLASINAIAQAAAQTLGSTVQPPKPIVEAPKRVVFFQSDKGGVGKSTAARSMIYYFRDYLDSGTMAVDTNEGVWSTAKLYAIRDANGEIDFGANRDDALLERPRGALVVDLRRDNGREALLDTIVETKAQTIVADVGAKEIDFLAALFGSVETFGRRLHKQYGFEVVVVHVLRDDAESAASLYDALVEWGPGIKHVAALVAHDTEQIDAAFDFFEGVRKVGNRSISPRGALELVDGTVFRMPTLFGAEKILKAFMAAGVPLTPLDAALPDELKSASSKGRIFDFLDAACETFDEVFSEVVESPGASKTAIAQIKASVKPVGGV